MLTGPGGAAAAIILALVGCTAEPEPARTPPATPAPDPGGWTSLAALPQPRTENSAVGLDGLVYVAGGFAAGDQLPTELFIYDPEPDTWWEGAPLPAGRHHAPLAAYDGALYLVGGFGVGTGDGWAAQDTLFVYDVATDRWQEGPPMPGPRGAHAVATTEDGQIHVVGGVGDGVRAEHFVFDTATETWSTLPPLPIPREHLAAAYLDGVVYVAAGRADGDTALRTFEAYDIAAQDWTTLPEVPTGRSGVAMAAFDGQIYLFGGETFGSQTSATYDEAERFDPARQAWSGVAPMPTARHGLGAAVLDDGITVVGGGPEAGLTFSGATEQWRPGVSDQD